MKRLLPAGVESSSTERRVLRTVGGKTVWADEVQLLGPGVHTALPAPDAVPIGSLFSCSTHSLIYRTDGSSWVTWATLGSGTGSGSLTVQDENGNVATGVTQIDFQGAGVNAAAGSGEVVVTIPGGSSGGSSGEATWTDATMQNSWHNFDSAGYSAPGFRKDGSGVVHLRGFVGGGTTGQPIFTLPVGYRPVGHQLFATLATGAFGWLDVFADGRLQLASGGTGWVSLFGVTFYAV